MELNSIYDIIEDIKNGKMIMLCDDIDRENECDLICAGEKITAETMAFIIRYTGGIVCTPITEDIAQKFNLDFMIKNNTDRHQTNFTESIDHIPSTTTGISALDRVNTVLALCNNDTKPSDFQKPGHLFPLISRKNLLKERRGHTEASTELMKLAHMKPVAVISELLNDDGSTKKGADLIKFSKEHNLKITTIEELYNFIYN